LCFWGCGRQSRIASPPDDAPAHTGPNCHQFDPAGAWAFDIGFSTQFPMRIKKKSIKGEKGRMAEAWHDLSISSGARVVFALR